MMTRKRLTNAFDGDAKTSARRQRERCANTEIIDMNTQKHQGNCTRVFHGFSAQYPS